MYWTNMGYENAIEILISYEYLEDHKMNYVMYWINKLAYKDGYTMKALIMTMSLSSVQLAKWIKSLMLYQMGDWCIYKRIKFQISINDGCDGLRSKSLSLYDIAWI